MDDGGANQSEQKMLKADEIVVPFPAFAAYLIVFFSCVGSIACAYLLDIKELALILCIGLFPIIVGLPIVGVVKSLRFKLKLSAIEIVAIGYAWLVVVLVFSFAVLHPLK